MNLEYKHLLPGNFSDNSRVWIYQSNRLLTMSEALEAEGLINQFCSEWLSHGEKVTAYGNLLFGQFLLLMADENSTTVGGCSTDASVRFVKEFGSKFNVDFFDRHQLAFVIKDKIELLPMAQLNYALENGFLAPETLYINTLVQTKKELEEKLVVPLKESWIGKRIKTPA